MTKIQLDDRALHEVRSFNRILAWLPRFRIHNRFTPMLVKAFLRASQVGADGRIARRGIGGERDPLRDDTVRMAARWREVAEVELHVLPEAPHGYLRFPTPLAQLAPARRNSGCTGEYRGP